MTFRLKMPWSKLLIFENFMHDGEARWRQPPIGTGEPEFGERIHHPAVARGIAKVAASG